MTAAVAVENATVRYGDRPVLSGASLTVRRGATTALLGPNGAGKTTLLRLLHLLERPQGGRVLFRGHPAPDDETGRLAARRRIAWVPQKPVALHRSVLHNVAYPLRIRGVARDDAEAAAAAALERVGLGRLAHAAAASVSGGEAQRVAFARATVTRPDVLLLDEFTASLDPGSARALEALAVQERDRGAAILLVTHSAPQARRLADEAAVLLHGRIAARGPVDAVLDRAEDPRVRAFLAGDLP